MFKNQKGQAVLIILLTMSVALTVVLSIIAASTSDIKIGTNESQSIRALSAAESGIQESLVTNTQSAGNLGSGASFNSNVSSLAQGQTAFAYPTSLNSADTATFWFVSHAANGSLTCSGGNCFTGANLELCWGANGTGQHLATTPALEMSVYYLNTPGNYSTVKVAKDVFDPNDPRRANNSYDKDNPGANCTVNGITYAFTEAISLAALGIPASVYNAQNGLQFLTARSLYNTDSAQPIALNVNFPGNSTLPSQGTLIDSTGSLDSATRKVEVSKVYAGVPPVFDTAIFSQGGISQ